MEFLYCYDATLAKLDASMRRAGVCALVTLFVKSKLNGVLFAGLAAGISGQLTF